MQGIYIHTWQHKLHINEPISSGVTHAILESFSEHLRQAVRVCTVDLQDPFTEVVAVSAQGGVTRLETVRNIAAEYVDQNRRVVAAFNGDFFSSLGIPSGLQITDGEIISSPVTTKVAMVITGNRSVELLQHVSMDAWLKVGTELKLSIDAVNRTRGLGHENHLFLYTDRFGGSTNTPQGGVEAIIEFPESCRLEPSKTLVGIVRGVGEQGNTNISKKSMVLSASGNKALWLLNNLESGDRVELQISYNQGVNEAWQVISGNSTLAYALLWDGKLLPEIINEQNPFFSDRHPRTIIATKKGKLYFITIDGRQPGYSDGLTLAESAYYLQALGMEDAINVDGGGSTTCLIRPLGESDLVVSNRPSDGFERPVGNGMIVLNTAPNGDLHRLLVEPNGEVTVLNGSTLTFKVKGVDQYLNPVNINHSQLKWSLRGSIGTISQTGQLKVESTPAAGTLEVSLDAITASVQLCSTDTMATLALESDNAILEPGSVEVFHPVAIGLSGEKIQLSPDVLQWSLEGNIGQIDASGTLAVSTGLNKGAVVVQYGPLIARKEVQIGKEPLVLVDFESTKGLRVQTNNVVPDSVTFKQVSRPQPIRFGAFSGRLSYDFSGQPGTSSVTIALLNENGEIGREIPGNPQRFGIWVYGDGKRHWLRLATVDAANNKRNLNFTALGGLDWVGWRYVTAELPTNTVYPITVFGIVLVEPSDANKNSGVVYFDNLRAEYVNLNEDLEGPKLGDFNPAFDSVVQEPGQITLRAIDLQTGVNPNSIQMWVNHNLVTTEFNEETGLITYTPLEPLAAGQHTVQIHVTDKAGNPSLPVDWVFRVAPQELARKRDHDAKQFV